MNDFLPYDPGVLPLLRPPGYGEVITIRVDGLPPYKDEHFSIRNPRHKIHDRFRILRLAATEVMGGRAPYRGAIALDFDLHAPEFEKGKRLIDYADGIHDTLDGSHGCEFTYLPIVYEDDCQIAVVNNRFVSDINIYYEITVRFLRNQIGIRVKLSDLIINAIDSLETSISYFLVEDFETTPKHATLGVFHAVELLLKERLHRSHPLFVYSNINTAVTSGANTVGMTDAIVRLANLGVNIKQSDRTLLNELQTLRNEIVHHRFDSSKDYRLAIGKALRFIYYFAQEHMGTTLEDLLPDVEVDTFRHIRELILQQEERLAEARQIAMESSSELGLQKRLPIIVCPNCGYETLVVGDNRGDFCYFCYEEIPLDQCEKCGKYVSTDALSKSGFCPECFDGKR